MPKTTSRICCLFPTGFSSDPCRAYLCSALGPSGPPSPRPRSCHRPAGRTTLCCLPGLPPRAPRAERQTLQVGRGCTSRPDPTTVVLCGPVLARTPHMGRRKPPSNPFLRCIAFGGECFDFPLANSLPLNYSPCKLQPWPALYFRNCCECSLTQTGTTLNLRPPPSASELLVQRLRLINVRYYVFQFHSRCYSQNLYLTLTSLTHRTKPPKSTAP